MLFALNNNSIQKIDIEKSTNVKRLFRVLSIFINIKINKIDERQFVVFIKFSTVINRRINKQQNFVRSLLSIIDFINEFLLVDKFSLV